MQEFIITAWIPSTTLLVPGVVIATTSTRGGAIVLVVVDIYMISCGTFEMMCQTMSTPRFVLKEQIWILGLIRHSRKNLAIPTFMLQPTSPDRLAATYDTGLK